MCDSALNSAGIAADQMLAYMPAASTRLRTLLDRCDHRSQSGTESALRVRLVARGFRVEVQPRLANGDYVDLRIGRLLIECDSRQFHTGVEHYQVDRRRDRDALLRGDLTMRLTYQDVFHDWARTLEDIRAVVGRHRHRVRSKNLP